MEKQYLTCEKTEIEYFSELTKLIANIKYEKRNKNFSYKLAKALICYKMADLGINQLEFKLLDKNCGYFGSQSFNVISINEKLMKNNLKNSVILIDCLLHEFNHQKTALKNNQIKKDEFGNANGEYVPKFYE